MEPINQQHQTTTTTGRRLRRGEGDENACVTTLVRKEAKIDRKVTSEQKGKTERGMISGIAYAAADLATALEPVPYVGSFSALGSLVGNALGRFTEALGFEKPVDMQLPTKIRRRYMNLTHGEGMDQAEVLATDPANHVDQLGREAMSSAHDHSLLDLIQIPQIVAKFTVTSERAGANLFTMPVHPLYSPANELVAPATIASNPTYGAYICNLFKHWRGSMRYTFKVFASNFHSGRIRITWIPTYGSYQKIGNIGDDIYHAAGRVIDIRGNTETSFEIPYLLSQPFAKSNVNEIIYLNELCRQTQKNITTGVEEGYKAMDFSTQGRQLYNGSLIVTVETPMTFPSVPIPTIEIVVYQSCGHDFQLAEPTTEAHSNTQFRRNNTAALLPFIPANQTDATKAESEVYFASNYPVNNPPTALTGMSDTGSVIPEDVKKEGLVEDGSGETPAPVVIAEPATTFEDQAVLDQTAPETPQTSEVDQQQPLQEILAFLARPRPILRHEWTTSDAPGYCLVIDPLSEFLKHNIIREKIARYQYIKADVVIEIRMNGTRFHYGAWGYAGVPMGAANSLLHTSLTYLSGFNGGVLTPDTESAHTIRMPFIYNKPFFDANEIGTAPILGNYPSSGYNGSSDGLVNKVNNGYLVSYPITSLRGGTVSQAEVSSVGISYFVHLENVVLEGYTPLTSTLPNSTVTTFSELALPEFVAGTASSNPRCKNTIDAILGFVYPVTLAAKPKPEMDETPDFSEGPPKVPADDSKLKDNGLDVTSLVDAGVFGERHARQINQTDVFIDTSGDITKEGYTNDELYGTSPPISSFRPRIVPPGAIHGEIITNVKQLISKPGTGFIINTVNSVPTFVAHFGTKHPRINQLRVDRGPTQKQWSNVSTATANRAGDTCWLTALRTIFLIERGSVAYKIIMRGTNSGEVPVAVNRNSKKAWITACSGINLPLLATNAPIVSDVNTRQPDQYAKSSDYVPGTATYPAEYIVPYHSDCYFHYVPRFLYSSLAAPQVAYMPQPIDCPGLDVKTFINQHLPEGAITIAMSAGDDFQFSHPIPPPTIYYTLGRNPDSLWTF
uniref:Putative capsid protein n=1 Tax=Red panda picorna-like virus TaxID=2864000 RepID=A0A8K1HJF4_9VIRU|nr:putative capsid protein [Red panda picorna-like virus]